MKKVLASAILAASLVLPLAGLAQVTPELPPESAPTVITTAGGLIDLIERIGNWVFAFLLAVAGVFLIYAGFLWVTAGGSPENVTKARTMLINALIGVAIALLARGAIAVVRGVIGA